MAHHYHDFFMTYDRPFKEEKAQQVSGSVEQEIPESKEENKEAKCSDTGK